MHILADVADVLALALRPADADTLAGPTLTAA